MITPDWNKNLNKERLPLVSSSQAAIAFAQSWAPGSLLGLMNHPAFHKPYCFFWGKFGQDLDKQYAEYALSLFLLEVGGVEGEKGYPSNIQLLEILDQFSKTLFSKLIFVTMMMILCISSHTEKHM